jgi:cell wall-associated NlpC family hydrolase
MKNFRIYAAIVLAALVMLIPLKCFSAPSVSESRQKLIDTAIELRGTPYTYAGKSPKGFDCSGFVYYVAKKSAGIKLPGSSRDMYAKVEHISADEKEPGDLMFFQTTASGSVSHVGIYLGKYNGDNEKWKGKRLFIHSASDGPETGVIITPVDDSYWTRHFTGWGRILPPSERHM